MGLHEIGGKPNFSHVGPCSNSSGINRIPLQHAEKHNFIILVTIFKITELCPRHNNEQFNLLAFVLDVHMHKTTIKLQIAANGKTYGLLIQQPNRLELMLHGELNQVHSTGEVCWKY